MGGGDPVSLTAPIIGEATGTSLDLGGTTLFASRAITVDTGGVLNIATGSAAGDDFTVNTSQFVVEGDTGNVGIGTTSPGAITLLTKGSERSDQFRIRNDTNGTNSQASFSVSSGDWTRFGTFSQYNTSYTTAGLVMADSVGFILGIAMV